MHESARYAVIGALFGAPVMAAWVLVAPTVRRLVRFPQGDTS